MYKYLRYISVCLFNSSNIEWYLTHPFWVLRASAGCLCTILLASADSQDGHCCSRVVDNRRSYPISSIWYAIFANFFTGVRYLAGYYFMTSDRPTTWQYSPNDGKATNIIIAWGNVFSLLHSCKEISKWYYLYVYWVIFKIETTYITNIINIIFCSMAFKNSWYLIFI